MHLNIVSKDLLNSTVCNLWGSGALQALGISGSKGRLMRLELLAHVATSEGPTCMAEYAHLRSAHVVLAFSTQRCRDTRCTPAALGSRVGRRASITRFIWLALAWLITAGDHYVHGCLLCCHKVTCDVRRSALIGFRGELGCS